VCEVIRIFCGYDEREAVGFHVFVSSVIRRSSQPVSFHPIQDVALTDGTNAFTYARYKVAEMCGRSGWAIFADACDMLVIADIAELWEMRDEKYAVQLVKHSYRTKNQIKYLGTSMQSPNVDYPRKNWSSLMLINCAAPEWDNSNQGKDAHTFNGFPEGRIGELPAQWNCLVDEGQDGGNLLHWTAGIPGFPHYKDAPFAKLWHEEHDFMRQCNV
jgi:lipopolysaccharide biosynthesis glycosyltransferase